MKDKNLYYGLWRKWLAVIAMKMKHPPQQFSMNQTEFEMVGNRPSAGFAFNLEIDRGRVVNNIDGSAVARDLRDILLANDKTREMLNTGAFKFSLSGTFVFTISIL